MLMKYNDDIAIMEESDVKWYKGCCRRCRAKMILVTLDMREEFLEEEDEWEERKSLGLVKLTYRSNLTDSILLCDGWGRVAFSGTQLRKMARHLCQVGYLRDGILENFPSDTMSSNFSTQST